jgi:hypothetical protein
MCDCSIIGVNSISENTNRQGLTMLNFITAYLGQWFDEDSNLHEYGSDLEKYILAHNPQNIHEVEQLARQYERRLTQGR